MSDVGKSLKLVVCVPALSRGGVHPRTVQSLWSLRLPPKDEMMLFMPVDRPTTSARSDAVRAAREYDAEALLFIDSDMEFQPDAYERLDLVDADMACAMFYRRRVPSIPTITKRGKHEDGSDILIPIQPTGGIEDIDACGMAFTLIRKPVLQAFDYPAFQHLGALSEDFVFCLHAREKGFSIKCDTRITISHRGDIGFAGQPSLAFEGMSDLSFPFGEVGDGSRLEVVD